MCEGSQVNAIVEFTKVPTLNEIDEYLEQQCVPGGTNRNWASYGHKIEALTERQKLVLADPQTSGGLLVAVEAAHADEFEALLKANHLPEANCISFGCLDVREGERLIKVL
jgi:selenide,water dikinase